MNNVLVGMMKQLKTNFLLISLLTSSSTFALHKVELTVNTNQPIGIINPNVYGQFMEHLGHGIYKGIWVGKESAIPNIKGYRTDVVEALKALKVPLVRWPGGCFADEYHWRDGIGKPSERPTKINTHWGGVEETNAFGTHEFFEFAELIGAQTYVNGNLGTGSALEMAEWMEYMTSDTNSTLGQLRRENGREAPFKVDFFAIGNEAWGCGGNMRPEYYADLYRHFSTFVKAPSNTKFIASGGESARTDWTEVLSKNINNKIDAIAHHYYTLPTGDWSKKGTAVGFPENEWMSTIVNTQKIEKFIIDNLAILDKNDPDKNIGFYVDEWGTWYDVEQGTNPGFLYQQSSIRDAVVAAVNFNIFHQYPERIQMTNIAQMVNVLQSMILTDGNKMLLTPTYHAFKMYIPFQNGQSLPVNIEKNSQYSLADSRVDAISTSAVIGKDGKTYLAVTNVDPNENAQVSVYLDKGTLVMAKGHILTAKVMDAHNTYDKPNTVKPAKYIIKAKNNKLILDVPAKSILVVTLE